MCGFFPWPKHIKHKFSSRNLRKPLHLVLDEQSAGESWIESPTEKKKSLMHLQTTFSTVNNTSFFTQSCQRNSNMTISKGKRDYSAFPFFAASALQCSAVVEVQHQKHLCICQHSSVYYWFQNSQRTSMNKKSEIEWNTSQRKCIIPLYTSNKL